MKKSNNYLILLFFVFGIFLLSCKPEPKESPIKGSLKCDVDESLFTMIEAIRDTFMVKYPESKIELNKVKAREGIVKVLNGESTIFVGTRELNKEEHDFVKKAKIDLRVIKFCYDALTVVVDSNHSLSRMTTAELKQLLLGESTQYKVFIPDQYSGIFENLKTDLLENKKPTGAKVVNSEEEVVKSVLKNKNSIGVVGLNIAKHMKGIKILRIGTDERSATGGIYYEPTAGYLSNGEYPLIRTCYIYLNEIGLVLGSGFSTFIASYEGQKIILSYDLGPATVPIKYKQITRLR